MGNGYYVPGEVISYLQIFRELVFPIKSRCFAAFLLVVVGAVLCDLSFYVVYIGLRLDICFLNQLSRNRK
jgi:hypothetical protein